MAIVGSCRFLPISADFVSSLGKRPYFAFFIKKGRQIFPVPGADGLKLKKLQKKAGSELRSRRITGCENRNMGILGKNFLLNCSESTHELVKFAIFFIFCNYPLLCIAVYRPIRGLKPHFCGMKGRSRHKFGNMAALIELFYKKRADPMDPSKTPRSCVKEIGGFACLKEMLGSFLRFVNSDSDRAG